MSQDDYEEIRLSIEDEKIDYSLARCLSEDIAATMIAEPLLIAWFDGEKYQEHPEVPECQHKPGWLAYAVGHG